MGADAQQYEIRVRGRLPQSYAAWFEGMTLTLQEGKKGEATVTIIRGEVRDQAALHGLISRIRDVGLTLIAVTQVSEVGGETN